MGKKIKNQISQSKKVNNTIDLEKLYSHLYNNYNMVIDFSFEGAFVSCKQGNFSNYLQSDKEFIQKFRDMMIDVQNLSQKTPNNIFRVYFIDYYHDFEYNQTKNERNKKNCKFCVINSIFE